MRGALVPVDVVLYCRGVLMGQHSAVVIMRPRQSPYGLTNTIGIAGG
jgi:hypothetical protein